MSINQYEKYTYFIASSTHHSSFLVKILNVGREFMALKRAKRPPYSTYGAAFYAPLIKVVCSNLGFMASVPLNLAGG